MKLSPDKAKLKVVERMLRIQGQANRTSKTAQESYARHFGKRVRRYPVFRIGDWVYLDRPPVWKKTAAEKISEAPSRKLAPKKGGPYRVLKVQRHTVTIDLKGIHKIVSIDGVTLATTATEVPRTADETTDQPPYEEVQTSHDDEDGR